MHKSHTELGFNPSKFRVVVEQELPFCLPYVLPVISIDPNDHNAAGWEIIYVKAKAVRQLIQRRVMPHQHCIVIAFIKLLDLR